MEEIEKDAGQLGEQFMFPLVAIAVVVGLTILIYCVYDRICRSSAAITPKLHKHNM